MSDPLYVIHENHLGERRYQPRLVDGDGDEERLYLGYWDVRPTWEISPRELVPILHRSRWKATRVARREMRRRWRERRNDFKEVEHE